MKKFLWNDILALVLMTSGMISVMVLGMLKSPYASYVLIMAGAGYAWFVISTLKKRDETRKELDDRYNELMDEFINIKQQKG